MICERNNEHNYYNLSFPTNNGKFQYQEREFDQVINFQVKEVGVAFWNLSITPQNNSWVVVKNLRIHFFRSIRRLMITHLKLNVFTEHH